MRRSGIALIDIFMVHAALASELLIGIGVEGTGPWPLGYSKCVTMHCTANLIPDTCEHIVADHIETGSQLMLCRPVLDGCCHKTIGKRKQVWSGSEGWWHVALMNVILVVLTFILGVGPDKMYDRL